MTDPEPDLARHRKGPVDPTGHVSSGIQTGPMRGVDAQETAAKEGERGRQDDGPERSTKNQAESRTDDTERNDTVK